MATRRAAKAYWEMTTDELPEATAEFDEEMVIDRSRPLNAKERTWWRRAQRELRASARNGSTLVAVRLNSELLRDCTALAKKKRISRDALIARGIKAVLAAEVH